MRNCSTSLEVQRVRSEGCRRVEFARLLAALTALSAVFCVSDVRGQSGNNIRVLGGGLAVDLATSWPDGPGYRPIQVTVTPGTVPVADSTLTIELTAEEQWQNSSNKIRVLQDIELPAGTGPVTATVSVPYLPGHNRFNFRIAENGRWVPGLSGSGSFQQNAGEERQPRVLVVADRHPDSTNLGRAFLNAVQHSPNSQYPLTTFDSVDPRDLPPRWIDYSALDLICVSIDDLESLRSTNDDAFRAIADWTAAGGNLLVYGLGAQWQQRHLLEELLELPSEDRGETRADSHEWKRPNGQQFGQRVSGIGPDVYGPFE